MPSADSKYGRRRRSSLEILLVIVVCTTVFMLQAAEAHAQREQVTVGLFENKPMCFTDESGRPAGIFIEVIEYAAEQEGWALHYQKGSWNDLLARLERGEVDVLPSMAVSEERRKLYTFNAIDVFNNWAEVYVGRTSGIISFLDLKEKRIASLRDGIYTSGPEGISVLNDRFHLNAKIVEVGEYRQAMAAVRDGTADAAVVNRLVGTEFAAEYDLQKSGIVFAPVAIRFAFNRESLKTPVLIEGLDRQMETLVADNNSVYHRAIIRALGETGYIETIPEWVAHALIGGSTALLVFMTMVFLLRKQVKVRTDSLQQSEEMFRSTFEQAALGIAHLSIDGAWLRVNRKLCDIVGYSREQLLQRTLQDITHPDDLGADLEFVKQVLAGAIDTYSMEKRYLRMDGSIVWINLTVSLVRDRDDKPLYFISVVEDISERKHLYEVLRLSEEKFALLFQNSPDSITLTSVEDGKLVEANSTFFTYTGYAEEEVIGRTSADLGIWQNPGDRQRYMEHIMSAGRVDGMEVAFRSKAGTILSGLISGDTVEIQGKKYILSVTRDISERKKVEAELKNLTNHLEEKVAERTVELENTQEALVYLLEDVNEAKEELETANEKLRELDRLKSMFIASMSHELRTPLNSIIGFSGIMLQGMSGEINGEQRDHLERVFRAGKHLLSLITDVIDIAKIESGKIHPYPEDFDLKDLVEEAVKSMQVQISDKGLDLVALIPETPVKIHSDRKRLLQCLLNYLSNAVKFSEKGVVTLAVTRGQGVPDGWVEISVSDTGIGIREQDLPFLFGSFVRFDSHLKTTTPGTGLGLYLTKKLAEEVLKGEVGAESEEGKGSRFWIRVPAVLNDE